MSPKALMDFVCSPFSVSVAAEAGQQAAALTPLAEQALGKAEAAVRGARLAAVKLRAQEAEVAPADLHHLAAQQLDAWHDAHSDATDFEARAKSAVNKRNAIA